MALRKIGARAVVLLALALVSRPGTTASAQAQPPTPKTPVFGAGVTLVAVPVFVTGKDGKSVPGLTADDFEVEADGKRTPIVSFQAFNAGESSVAAPSDVTQPDIPIAVQAAAPRQFLLLLDLEFSPITGIVRVRKEAAEFIKTVLAPGDLVAIAISNQAGLKVLTNFTSDHAFAARAVSGIGFSESAVADPLGLGGSLGMSSGSGSRADEEMEEQEREVMEVERSAYLMRASSFISDVTELVKKISPLRGRKQIVLLSAGFSENAWSSVAKAGRTPDTEPQMTRLNELFRRAGEGDVVIHTVSLEGLEGPISLTTKSGRDDLVRSDTLNGGAPPTLQGLTNRGAVSGRGTLSLIAGGTGGRAVLPGNNFGKLLEEVEHLSRHSYVIAFEAPDSAGKNEKPRKLKVRVRRPGLSVSHRPTYSSAPPTASASSDTIRLQAAEAISKGLNTGPLRLNLVTLPYVDRDGKTSVHAVLQIDGAAFVEESRGPQLVVQVYGYLLSAGRVLDSMTLNTSIDLTKVGAAVRESGLHVVAAFAVPPGAADLRFSVRAGAGDTTGSIQRNVTIPAFTDGTPFLSTPMFTLPTTGKAVLPYRAKDRPPIQIPFYVEAERFLPDALVTLIPGQSREAVIFARPAHSPRTSPVDISAEIGRPGQAFVSVKVEDVRVVSDADGFDRMTFVVTAPDVPSGNYVVRFAVRDPSSGGSGVTEAMVMVEHGADRR